MYSFLIFFCILSSYFVNSVYADFVSTPETVLKYHEYVTPEVQESHQFSTKPVKFSTSNNLRRKTGSPFIAKGQFIIIEGVVTDLLGAPIENTKIKIWHTNYFGYYNYLIPDQDDYSKVDIDFEPTGTTITDESGYYRFFSIIPGFFGNFAPYINILLENEIFGTMQTLMFFEAHPRNMNDRRYLGLNMQHRKLVTCHLEYLDSNNPALGTICSFNIKINIIHPRKRY